MQPVQMLLDEEFPGIRHIRTSTLHKKVSTARHDFVRLSGSENKLEALLQARTCSSVPNVVGFTDWISWYIPHTSVTLQSFMVSLFQYYWLRHYMESEVVPVCG